MKARLLLVALFMTFVVGGYAFKPDSLTLSKWKIGIATGYHGNLMRFPGLSKEYYYDRDMGIALTKITQQNNLRGIQAVAVRIILDGKRQGEFSLKVIAKLNFRQIIGSVKASFGGQRIRQIA